MKNIRTTLWTAVGLFALAAIVAVPAAADQVIADDLIVDGSACIGFDCVNGESFGFDTIRIKENNLRIKAQDTSSSASFPTEDWQLTFNDSSNGGANFFGVEDLGPIGSGTVFKVFAGAGNNAMVLSSSGKLGIGTGSPVTDIEIKSGNTPTLRLCQDGSSGFSPQTWDVAGNEANFFIRDVTNGSTLPFRIRPGAPTSAIDIEGTTGDVGIGTSSPTASLHVRETSSADATIRVEDTDSNATVQVESAGGDAVLELTGSTAARILMDNGSGESFTNTLTATGNLIFNASPGAGGNEFTFAQNGNLTILGDFFSATCTSPGNPCAPDYVFEADYELMPLDELEAFVKTEKHLPKVPSQADLISDGRLNMSMMQMTLLEKVEELVLYTIDQQKEIDRLAAELAELKGQPE